MAEGELKDMEQFFDDLSDSFTGTEPEVHKTSVVGLFLRHMILAYNKLSFSQVYKLYTALQQYFQNDEKKDGIDESDMELTNTEELEGKMEKEELDAPLRRWRYPILKLPRGITVSRPAAHSFLPPGPLLNDFFSGYTSVTC
nr:PREDICTED: anaphase-promoting complex subunit 5 isoform X1 [Apteryx mantelli mantelli]